MALTRDERRTMAMQITEAMFEHYSEHGEEENADWADGERYLRDDAPDDYLRSEHARWCNKS